MRRLLVASLGAFAIAGLAAIDVTAQTARTPPTTQSPPRSSETRQRPENPDCSQLPELRRDRLIAEPTVQVMVDELFPLAGLITPNLDEAAWLLGRPIADAEQLDAAARELQALGAPAVLLKGGHLSGAEVVDVLLLPPPAAPLRWRSPRIASRNTHGTGYTLSTAIACRLALGLPLVTHDRRIQASGIAVIW